MGLGFAEYADQDGLGLAALVRSRAVGATELKVCVPLVTLKDMMQPVPDGQSIVEAVTLAPCWLRNM